MRVAPGATFTWTPIETGTTGLLGTIAAGIYHGDTATVPLDDANVTNEIGASGIYEASFIAPATAGSYVLIASLDGSLDPDQVITEEFVVTSNIDDVPTPSGFDLCTLDDVKSYVPAYDGTADDAILQRLITAESDLIASETGREIIGREGSQPAARRFAISATDAQLRTIPVDDLDGTNDIVVKLVNTDGTVGGTIADDSVVPLYDGQLSPIRGWEPVTALSFPYGRPQAPALFGPDLIIAFQIEVLASWGFPTIPSFIREACAARVVLRYLSDVAAAGTDFANAVNVSNLNLSGLVETSDDALEALTTGVVIA